MNAFNSFETQVIVNGKVIPAHIDIYVENDESVAIEDLSDDPTEQARIIRQLDRSDLMIATVTVKASALGLDGYDSLGAVFIKSPSDAEETLKEYDMVNNAIAELQLSIWNKYQELYKILGNKE